MSERFLASLLLLLIALPVRAHDRKAPPTKLVHKIEQLTPHAYVLFGDGGNIGLLVTNAHAILVDDQSAELAPALIMAVRSITDKPIRYLINTHHHDDHTGANAALEKQVQLIVAHVNARSHLIEDPNRSKGGLPEIGLGDADPKVRARLELHPDDQLLVLSHTTAGHTDGDIVVFMPKEKVVHMGDLFFNGLLPFIDLDSGGTLAGYLESVEAALKWIPPGAKVIPGHGPVGDVKSLTRFRDLLRALATHARAHRGEKPKDAAASFDQKAWSDFHPMENFVTWESLMDVALKTAN